MYNISTDWTHEIDDNPVFRQKINAEEIAHAIQSARSRSAPGCDGISYCILQNLPNAVVKWLAKFYNHILDSGKYPQHWKDFKVCFIPKPNNKGFRPIAMASTLLKTLERVINDRLQWWIEPQNLLPSYFYGFRRNRSCADCLAILHTDITLSRLRLEPLCVLSLDLEGAYDSVNLEILLEILVELQVPNFIIKFVYNLINERKIYGFCNGYEFASGSTNKGLPQGCILSPLLFNIYIHYIKNKLIPSVKCLGFADDLLIYCSDPNIHKSINILNEQLSNLQQWLNLINLKISFQKCNLIIFDSKNPPKPGEYFLEVGNHKLFNKDSFRYLGVTWDQENTWENTSEQQWTTAN